MRYDAKLTVGDLDTCKVGQKVWGFIHEDSKGRFNDGTFVKTSVIVDVLKDMMNMTFYIKTQNTIYKVEVDNE